MKILMLGWELPPHNSGGLGVACYHLSKALAMRGASIDFVVPYSAYHPNAEFMNIIPTSQRSPLERYGGFGAYDSRDVNDEILYDEDGNPIPRTNNIRDIQRDYVRFIENYIANHHPDVIHAHDWLTMEAGMRAKELSGAPLIVHVHATEFDRSGREAGNPIVHEIEYQGLMMADRIIAVSNLTKAIIIQKYQIPADKIEVMHNAINVDDFATYDYDRRTFTYLEALKSEGYMVVSTVGRFTVQKGLHQLVRGFARASEKHPKLLLLLVGDGEQRDELINLSAELGVADKVFFTGFIRGKQWRDAYSVSDIFVLSSVSEPFGLVALEAAHHDTALVISKQSGVGEVLNSILRYDFWDTEKLADQLVGIAASRALFDELCSGSKREYANISWHDVAERCLQLYESARAKPGGILV